MSNTASTISVLLEGKDVGLSTLLTQVDAKTQKSADSAARLQAQCARLASAQGNSAQATNILSNAFTNNGGASARVVTSLAQQLTVLQKGGGAMTQFASAANGLTSTLGQLGGQLSQMGGSSGALAGSLGNLAGSFGTLGGIGALLGLGKVAIDMGVAGANADLLRTRFDGLAVAAGTTGDALITALRAASGGEISDLNLTLAANKAQLLGVAKSAEEFGVLMGIARDRAQQMGISTTQAFDNLTTGLGRGSALILDNLGIIVSVKEANETYAKSIGTTAAALTEAQQKQALINTVLAQGKASLDATGGAVNSNASSFARLGVVLENTKTSFGSAIGTGLEPYARSIADASDATQAAVAWVQQLGTASASSAAATAANAAGVAAYNTVITQSGSVLQANAAYEAAHAAALAQSSGAAQVATDIEQQRLNVLAAAAALTQQSTTAQLGYADSLAMVGVQANAAAQAAQQKGTADQVAAVDAQTHALAQQQLATAAQSAAQALLAGGQAGANTAALLAGSSSRVDVLTAAYYRLAAAQAAAKVADPLKGVTEDRSTRDTTADRAKVKSDQALESNRKLLASIAAVEKAANKPPKGGGGGPKLTDQQKLNNSLQADQTSADTKYEDAAKAHLKRLLDIQKDFAAKSLAQQQSNEISKRQSQADFYDRLTSSDLNKKAGGSAALQKIDADYQAAYQKSQEIAQAGNAKLAADYLALKQKQAESELTFQENTAKAAADKDKAEVDRLAKIQALRRAAQAEEEKQLLAGGDTNVNERDKALADEEAKNQESQDKIGTAAERAADRKIAASVANGNAVDAEIARVNALGTAYGKLPPPRGSAATGAGTTPTTPDALPAAPGDSPTGAIVSALNGAQSAIVSAINAVQSATKDGASKVAGAISSLPRSVS